MEGFTGGPCYLPADNLLTTPATGIADLHAYPLDGSPPDYNLDRLDPARRCHGSDDAHFAGFEASSSWIHCIRRANIGCKVLTAGDTRMDGGWRYGNPNAGQMKRCLSSPTLGFGHPARFHPYLNCPLHQPQPRRPITILTLTSSSTSSSSRSLADISNQDERSGPHDTSAKGPIVKDTPLEEATQGIPLPLPYTRHPIPSHAISKYSALAGALDESLVTKRPCAPHGQSVRTPSPSPSEGSLFDGSEVSETGETIIGSDDGLPSQSILKLPLPNGTLAYGATRKLVCIEADSSGLIIRLPFPLAASGSGVYSCVD